MLKKISFIVAGCFSVATASFANHAIHAPEVHVKGDRWHTLPTLTDENVETHELHRLRANTSDTASLLAGRAGIDLVRAGGVSSLPSIRGLADDRIRIKVNGIDLISACANHMNPPLSYIDPANVDSVRVFAGITPVSMGGDSIAGTIIVDSASSEFSASSEEFMQKGRISTFYRSNNNAHGVNLSASIASDRLSLRYNGAITEAYNYHAGSRFRPSGSSASGRGWIDGDEVGSAAYKTENHALELGFRLDNHLIELGVAIQNIPYQNFPNQRMDMSDNDSERFNLHYTGEYGWGALHARAWYEHTRHRMNFGDDKQFWYMNAPGMPMETEGKNTGFSLQGDIVLSEQDILRVGTEYQSYRMDDEWPASGSGMMMGPGTFHNIRNGKRDRYAMFGEWEKQWTPQWMTQLGVRYEAVKMDAGSVRGYNTMGGMMGYGDPNDPTTVPGSFNAFNRSKTDRNVDLTAIASFVPDKRQAYEIGYAMKTRSPNLYERYVWSSNNSMVMNMNNWYGDGNGYVGNLDLDPEIAHTLSFSGNWHDAEQERWDLKLTPYLTYVHDYIDAVECGEVGKTCPARADGFVNLSLDNQRARILGVDLSGKLLLVKGSDLGSVEAIGVISYTRGRNLTTGEDLYRIMPLNMSLSLGHRLGQWSNALELKLVDAKERVQDMRRELKTSGYGLLNFYSSYEWTRVRLDIGIENMLDKHYEDPLGGAYLGQGATMGTGVLHGLTVPGMGRSINTALTLTF